MLVVLTGIPNTLNKYSSYPNFRFLQNRIWSTTEPKKCTQYLTCHSLFTLSSRCQTIPPVCFLLEPCQNCTTAYSFFLFSHAQVAIVSCTTHTVTLQGHQTCSWGNHKTLQRSKGGGVGMGGEATKQACDRKVQAKV